MDPEAQDLEAATAKARDEAAHKRDQLLQSLAWFKEPLADALNNLVAGAPNDTVVLNSSTGPSNSFTADVAMLVRGTAGSGWSHKDVWVRLCVRYSGKLGPDPHVDMADLTCPPGLPSYRGPIEHTVTLK